MSDRSRSSEHNFLFRGQDLEPGEELVWCSSPKSEIDGTRLGQLVLTDRRLLFEPFRVRGPGTGPVRRWGPRIEQIKGVEVVRQSRPWPVRGILRVTLADGAHKDFRLSAGGGLHFPISKHEPALQEAYNEISGALRAGTP